MIKYSVLIPAYNESKNIPILVDKVKTSFDNLNEKDFEVIVINDCSTDDTYEVTENLKKIYPFFNVYHRRGLKGPGRAKRLGFSKVKGEYVITMDGDLSHDPSEIPKFIEKSKDFDLVCGSRYVEKGKAEISFSRKIISGAFNIIFRRSIGLPVKDFTSGYRLIKKEILDKSNFKSKGFGIYVEIPISAYLLNYRLGEVPITYHKRLHGTTNLNYTKEFKEYTGVAVRGIFFKFLKIIKIK